jgi:multidrug efflux pump subunit AcrB
MRNLAKFFIENPKLTMVVSVFLILFGWMGLTTMNAESYPSVDFATAVIETEYFGATPEDIEVKITKPIEDELRGVSGIKDVRSVSQSGRSKIVIRVDMDNPKVIVKDVMGDIQRAMDRAKNLPTDLLDKPKFTELKSEEFAAIEVAVIGGNDHRQRDLIAYSLKEDIEDDKNVKAANLDGYREREFEIRLSRKKLDSFHISVNEVLLKIGGRNVNIPGGEIETTTTQQIVKVDAKIRSAKELADTPIRSTFSGKMIYLRDIAEVRDGEEDANTLTRFMGEPATLVSVLKKGGADTLKLVDQVEPVLERYRQKHKDYKFVVYWNEANIVKDKLDTLSSNAVSGLVVVVAVLLFFMPGRLGVTVAISLPVILLSAIGLMPYFDLTLNSISILALIIAMGMLVDNAVVITEEYIRRRELGSSSLDAAVDTVHNMWIPISATAFTTIAAFLPMMVMTGIMGRFITPIPMIVTAALLFCLMECFLLLPMRVHLVAKDLVFNKAEVTKKHWFDKVSARFEKFIEWTVDHRYWTALGITGVIIVSFLILAVGNKFILFPADQTEIYIARIEMPENTRIEKTYEVTRRVEEKIIKVLGPELLKHSVSVAGNSATDAFDPRGKFGDNMGVVRMMATDYAKFNVPYTVVLEKLRTITDDEVTTLTFEEMLNGPPVGAPVEVTFRSSNGEQLQSMVEKIMDKLKNTKGVFDVRVDDVFGPPEVKVNLNFEKIDRLGLTPSQVGDTIRTALTGTFISDVTLNNKKAYLKVEFGDISKTSIQDLGNVKITDSRGNLIPLSLLATFESVRGTAQVKRYDFKRAKTVTANVRPDEITSLVANQMVFDTYHKLSKELPDVSYVVGGEQESTNESMESLANAMVLALVGIYAIMVYIFRSYLAPGLIMTTIPLGLLGVSISFWAHDKPVSFLAMIGVIGLAGIIVNNGIILIDFINQMRDEGKLALREILIKAPTIRLKPVMATSLTTMGGLFPTAYGVGGEYAMLVPLTLAMAWGLTTGTILTLVWIPSGYAIIEDMMTQVRKLIARFKRS